MSVDVINAVFHAIQPSLSDEGEIKAIERQAPLDTDAALAGLVEQLHSAFNAKASKGFAYFKPEPSEQGFHQLLQSYINGDESFLPFSSKAVNNLAAVMQEHGANENGMLFICHYRMLARPYLLFLMVSQSASYRVDETLSLQQTQHLDIDKMQLVARVDIDSLDIEQRPPLAFVRGRVGRQVSDFFLEFLEGEVRQDPKEQGKALVQAIDSYSQEAQLSVEERSELGKTTVEYCKERNLQGEMVQLSDLSKVIEEQGGYEGFENIVEDASIELPETINVAPSALRELSKFSGSGRGVSVSFDRKLLGESVQFDPVNGLLIIKQIPPNLLDQLTRAVQSSSD